MSFKNYWVILGALVFLSCKNSTEQIEEPAAETEVIIIENDVPDVEDQWSPNFEVLPSCETKIEDEDFLAFYNQLIRSCLDYDSLGICDLVHDSVKFSQYECYDDHWIVPENCENCIRCTKEGIMKGVFGRMNKKQMAEHLYHMLTFYGVGKLEITDHYMASIADENTYANFNFIDKKIQKDYFNYSYILPKRKGIAIRKTLDIKSERIGELPFEAIKYENEVGMGEYAQNKPNHRWLPYKNGYILADDVTSGFDFTLLFFEKTHAGWRITGFFQPPGC